MQRRSETRRDVVEGALAGAVRVDRPGERDDAEDLDDGGSGFDEVVLFEAFEIEGPSMEPTLLNGDRVVVSKSAFGLFLPFMHEAVTSWGMPNPGDVVILNSPYDGIDIVKRVIGVPGDRVRIDENEVFVNGESIRRRVLAK